MPDNDAPPTRKPATRKPAPRAKPAGAAKSPAGSGGARSGAAKPASSRAKTSAGKSAPGAKRTPSAAKADSAPSGAAGAARSTVTKPVDPVRVGLTRVRDLVGRGIVVSRERIQETMDDAVNRGRLVRRDADELTERLLASGRQQTQDVLADIEQLLGRGRGQVGSATKSARVSATRRSDAVLREVDKARRRAGIGSFPVLGYDDLTAEQIVRRLGDLSPAELRKVRDYELRHGNRKSVLGTIERKLA